jgi:hypothetical protein
MLLLDVQIWFGLGGGVVLMQKNLFECEEFHDGFEMGACVP